MVDVHVPNLLVFPPTAVIYDLEVVQNRELIIQSKSSCFPAFILSPPLGAHAIDACAAPGNKTSQLAAIMNNSV